MKRCGPHNLRKCTRICIKMLQNDDQHKCPCLETLSSVVRTSILKQQKLPSTLHLTLSTFMLDKVLQEAYDHMQHDKFTLHRSPICNISLHQTDQFFIRYRDGGEARTIGAIKLEIHQSDTCHENCGTIGEISEHILGCERITDVQFARVHTTYWSL